MKKNSMITFEDGTKYVLLDESFVNDIKYFFAVEVNKENENPTTNYEVFEEVIEDGEKYLDFLDECDFKQALLLDFTNNYMNEVTDILDGNKNIDE